METNKAENLNVLRNDDGSLPSYTPLGGYPLLYLDDEDETLCAKCATIDLERDTTDDLSYSPMVHFEGSPVFCAECNEEIHSAYGDPDK